MNYGHWISEVDFDFSEWFGFVYLITNLTNNRKYIGKKQFSSRNRIKVKGRKNRKVVITESTWKDYTSSSEELNQDIIIQGKDKFRFEILKLCKTKRDLGYTEVKEQFDRNVLEAKLESGEREYYNRNIMSRWFANT